MGARRSVRMSVEERRARGRAARKAVPRSSHAEFSPRPDRPDPVALLQGQALTRVPELVPIRYGRMLQSPFAFFRGAALVMASDLAATPTTGIEVQACGDAHLSNFGFYGTPERRLVFDINDFDETLPGPWEWDVKRLAASLEIAARDADMSPRSARSAVLSTVEGYRRGVREFAAMTNLQMWYSQIDAESLLARIQRLPEGGGMSAKRVRGTIDKALTRDSMQAVSKLTRVVDGRRRFISSPPLVMPISEIVGDPATVEAYFADTAATVSVYRATLQTDRQHLLDTYELVDVARKVVGVGSVGMRSWIILMQGCDENDLLLLQMKEAQASVLEEFLSPCQLDHHGQRIVAGQRLIQTASDLFLGWHRGEGLDGVTRDFYIRQLRDWKASAELDALGPEALASYGRLCGWTLAKAHSRSGDRVAIAAYLGSSTAFDEAIADFASAYADQNDRDAEELRRAVDSGQVAAEFGH